MNFSGLKLKFNDLKKKREKNPKSDQTMRGEEVRVVCGVSGFFGEITDFCVFLF